MEQIIEEYGIGGILFVIGTGVLAGLGKVLQLIAWVQNMAAVVKEYGGAVLAALGGEMQVARNRLTGALASLLGVSHFFELS